MRSKLPADGEFVDQNRKIVPSWLDVLKTLEPFLKIATPENVATLLSLIDAAQTAQEGDDTTALDPFAVAVDEEPLFSEDFVFGWRTALSAARRFPLSLFATPQLISTTAIAGATTGDFVLPTGYTSVELRIFGASTTSGAPVITAAFSEDGGSTFLSQAYYTFSAGGIALSSASATAGSIQPTAVSNTDSHYGRLNLWNYGSATSKYAETQAFMGLVGSTTLTCVGSHLITSTAPVDLIRLEVSAGGGNFDAGTVELWGIP